MRRTWTIAYGIAAAISAASAAQAQRNDVELHLVPVQGNVYMLHGGEEGNIAVQIGDDGVMVVNAMRQGLADSVSATCASLDGSILPASA